MSGVNRLDDKGLSVIRIVAVTSILLQLYASFAANLDCWIGIPDPCPVVTSPCGGCMVVPEPVPFFTYISQPLCCTVADRPELPCSHKAKTSCGQDLKCTPIERCCTLILVRRQTEGVVFELSTPTAEPPASTFAFDDLLSQSIDVQGKIIPARGVHPAIASTVLLI